MDDGSGVVGDKVSPSRVGSRVEGLKVGIDTDGFKVYPVEVGDFVGECVYPSGVGKDVVGDLLG